VFVLDDNEVYGRGIASLFKERCQEIGIKVGWGHDSIDAKSQEYKSLYDHDQGKTDLVYFGGTTQSKGGQVARTWSASA